MCVCGVKNGALHTGWETKKQDERDEKTHMMYGKPHGGGNWGSSVTTTFVGTEQKPNTDLVARVPCPAGNAVEVLDADTEFPPWRQVRCQYAIGGGGRFPVVVVPHRSR